MITLDELGRVEETRRLEMTMTLHDTPGVSASPDRDGTTAASGQLSDQRQRRTSRTLVRGIVAAFTEAAIRAVQPVALRPTRRRADRVPGYDCVLRCE